MSDLVGSTVTAHYWVVLHGSYASSEPMTAAEAFRAAMERSKNLVSNGCRNGADVTVEERATFQFDSVAEDRSIRREVVSWLRLDCRARLDRMNINQTSTATKGTAP